MTKNIFSLCLLLATVLLVPRYGQAQEQNSRTEGVQELRSVILGRDLERVGFSANILATSDDCSNKKLVKLVELSLESASEQALEAVKAGVGLDLTGSPNLREGVSRALTQARNKGLNGRIIANLEQLRSQLEAFDAKDTGPGGSRQSGTPRARRPPARRPGDTLPGNCPRSWDGTCTNCANCALTLREKSAFQQRGRRVARFHFAPGRKHGQAS